MSRSRSTSTDEIKMHQLKTSYGTIKHCKAEGCLSNRTERIPFFSFPADEIRSQIWVERSGNELLHGKSAPRLHQYAKLCCKHFESTEFTNDLQNRLHRDALPSIFTHTIKPELEGVNIEANYLLDISKQGGRTSTISIPKDNRQTAGSGQLDVGLFLKPRSSLHPNLLAGGSQIFSLEDPVNPVGLLSSEVAVPTCTSNVLSLQINAYTSAKHVDLPGAICRLCLVCVNEATAMQEIFDGRSDMQLKIISLAEIELYPGDCLPTQICRQCIRQIDLFYQFRTKCQTSDKHLRQLLEEQLALGAVKLKEEIGSPLVDKTKILPDQRGIQIDSTNLLLVENSQWTDPLLTTCDESSSEDESLHEDCLNNLSQTSYPPSENKNDVLGKFLVVDVNVLPAAIPKNISPNPFGHCPTCFKSFTNKGNLKKHMRIHSEEGKIYRCTICDKGFTQSQSRTAHMTTHTKARAFKCSICTKAYTRASTLKVHMECHSNTVGKRYCKICDKNFTNLQNHMRKHTGEHPYGCTYCERTFALAGTLSVHLRMHRNEYPYHCPETGCMAKFRQRQGLMSHEKKHGELPEKLDCDLCEESFVSRKDIREHLFRVHDVKKSK